MKILFLIPFFILSQASAQSLRSNLDWRSMNDGQRRALVNKMSPEERMQMLRQFRENMIISDLSIPQGSQEEFRKVFSEYQESQKNIREKFRPDFQSQSLSDEDARKKLDESFKIGQELLDNRKKFAERFGKILTPQQVLQLFQNEGKMRDKMMEHRPQESFQRTQGRP